MEYGEIHGQHPDGHAQPIDKEHITMASPLTQAVTSSMDLQIRNEREQGSMMEGRKRETITNEKKTQTYRAKHKTRP